jgi:hypothetical protein
MSDEGFLSSIGPLCIPQITVSNNDDDDGKLSQNRTSPGWIKGTFIRGPLPLSWWSRACALRGTSPLAVSLAIWFLAGLKGRKDQLMLPTPMSERFHIDRSAKLRGLKALEKAGLIRVQRRGNKNPIVTIIEQLDEAS